MTLLQSGLAKSLAASYDIDNSLRFDDGDSAYLSRTPGSDGNRTTWTFSAWVKRGNLGTRQIFLAAREVSAGKRFYLEFSSSDQIGISEYTTGVGYDFQLVTTPVYRDPGAWYHILFKYDSTPATPSSSSVSLYVNGEQVTAFDTEDYPSQNDETAINCDEQHTIGERADLGGSNYDGYLAEVYFIDGTALTPSSFGELDSDTNQWIPIDASGLTFGTNGFYQKYGAAPGPTTDAFTSTGADTWTCPAGVTSADILIVAGAGGGGYSYSGGGGGGGIVHHSTYSVTAGVVYDLTVGAGGAGGTSGSRTGTAGSDSVFNVNAEGSGIAMTASGGGGGASAASSSASAGGSGGGGSYGASHRTGGASDQGAVTGATVYGNDGGDGYFVSDTDYCGGGGGGASAVGADGTANQCGNGGAGQLFSNFTSYGASGYFGGGGGGSGGTYYSDLPGSGGSGGGGGGGTNAPTNNGTAGTANTGGGGGGGGTSAGNGGSGVILIRYGISFGNDYSGNNNDFTVTNLVATDQVLDSPTNNFATLNPLVGYSGYAVATPTFSEGNLKCKTNTSGGGGNFASNFAVSSGKWYTEYYIESESDGDLTQVGLTTDLPTLCDAGSRYFGGTSTSWGLSYNGYIYNNDSGSAYDTGMSFTIGDVVSTALDLENSKLYFAINGTWMNSGVPTSGATGTGAVSITSGLTDWVIGSSIQGNSADKWIAGVMNFGADSSFAGNLTAQGNQDGNEKGDFYYEPPTDYLALCSDNLPSPEIALPGDNFNTKLYTGDGATTLAVSSVGFQPDFTWIKNRDEADDHTLVDSVRGATKYLVSNENYAEVDDSTFVASLDSDGFTVGDDVVVNTSTENYVSWNWKGDGVAGGTLNEDGTIDSQVNVNTTAGFSIVSYTGQVAAGTIGHGLSQAPELIIAKIRSSADTWWAGSDYLTSWVYKLILNDTSAEAAKAALWNSTAPTADVFSVGTDGLNGVDGRTYVAYCFHSVEGYSKVGSYEGNGVDNGGPFVYTGHEPAMTIIKSIDQVREWWIMDNKRDPYNDNGVQVLWPDTNDAEGDDYTNYDLDYLSNGFKVMGDNSKVNESGQTYLFYSVAESPFKTSNAR